MMSTDDEQCYIHFLRLIAVAIEMNSSGLNQGTSGNLSVRVPGGFLITPSGRPYETLLPEHVRCRLLSASGLWNSHMQRCPTPAITLAPTSAAGRLLAATFF